MDKNVKKKGLFFRFIVRTIKLFYKGSEFIDIEKLPTEPCVVVGNHSQIHGPFLSEGYIPFKKLTWCDGPMMDKKEFPEYAHNNFWGGKPNGFQRFLAKLIAPLVAYVFKNADALPVYRDVRVMKTYKASVDALNDGINLVIFAESPEPHNEIINELNEYFVDVARFFYKKTGKGLLFAPMYYAPTIKKVIFGNPIRFDGEDSIENQRKVICKYLMDEITRIAKELPVHTVIPFNVGNKKEYKKSK